MGGGDGGGYEKGRTARGLATMHPNSNRTVEMNQKGWVWVFSVLVDGTERSPKREKTEPSPSPPSVDAAKRPTQATR
jgi:hypothetical protein